MYLIAFLCKTGSTRSTNTHTNVLIMARYAWYTRATDTLHRLTVLTIIGGSLYMTGGLVYTLYMNGKRYEQKVITDKKDEMNQLEGAMSSSE